MKARNSAKHAAIAAPRQGNFMLPIEGGKRRAAHGHDTAGAGTFLGKWQLLGQVLCDRALSRRDGAVAWVIFNHFRDGDAYCFPSYERIAEQAGIDRREAMRAVKRLVERGYLEQVRGEGGRNKGGRARVNRYRPCLERVAGSPPFKAGNGGESCMKTVADSPPDYRAKTPNKKKRSDAAASGAGAPGADRDGIPLCLIGAADGDWSKPLFRQGLAWLAQLLGKPPDRLRSAIGKLLQLTGGNHKRVFDGLAEAQASAIADPMAWLTARFGGKNGKGTAGPGDCTSRRPTQAERRRRLVGSVASELGLRDAAAGGGDRWAA